MSNQKNNLPLKDNSFPFLLNIFDMNNIPLKTIGIYRITSPIGRIYIGQSRDIICRFRVYKSLKCKGQRRLYNSLMKYGLENHRFELICICEIVELNDLECHYIKLNDSFNTENGLNLRIGGDAKVKISDESRQKMKDAQIGIEWRKDKDKVKEAKRKISESNKGKKLSEEHKAKLRGKQKGNKGIKRKPLTKEHKENIGKAGLGKKASPETKLKMSMSQKGRKPSAETIRKVIEANTGRKHTEDSKQKMRDTKANNKGKTPNANLGRKHSEESKKKKSDAMKGRKFSPETKLKMSASSKGRKPSEETIRRIKEVNTGKKHTKEHRQKIRDSIANKEGKSPNGNIGKKHTEETRKKLSELRVGKKKSPESIKKREATKKRNRELIEEEKRMMVF